MLRFVFPYCSRPNKLSFPWLVGFLGGLLRDLWSLAFHKLLSLEPEIRYCNSQLSKALQSAICYCGRHAHIHTHTQSQLHEFYQPWVYCFSLLKWGETFWDFVIRGIIAVNFYFWVCDYFPPNGTITL